MREQHKLKPVQRKVKKHKFICNKERELQMKANPFFHWVEGSQSKF